ncbi:hypothetical protein B0H63DRAFT_143457 [Podospora didyma]|uniref:Uncharacterized protein n=1 Tax=Podospora didyma TaxID=330526 RepID=A0AAE0NSL9_9PEZI|nr:hypothetical protein B0H63DRAFT_143457 [Podospora didyma]
MSCARLLVYSTAIAFSRLFHPLRFFNVSETCRRKRDILSCIHLLINCPFARLVLRSQSYPRCQAAGLATAKSISLGIVAPSLGEHNGPEEENAGPCCVILVSSYCVSSYCRTHTVYAMRWSGMPWMP